MFAHPQWFVGFDASLCALFGGAIWVNLHEVRGFTLAPVFERIGEDSEGYADVAAGRTMSTDKARDRLGIND